MGSKNKHLCLCGSGKRMKLCCGEAPRITKHCLTSHTKLQMRIEVEALAEAGKHLEACQILEQLIVVSPPNPLIWNDLGIQYEAAGQIEKAFDALRRGHQCDSTYPPILYNLGKFTLNRFLNLQKAGTLVPEEAQGLLEKAITFLNANLDRDPDNADAHYNLARAYALDQNEQKAHAHMTVALRISQELADPSEWL